MDADAGASAEASPTRDLRRAITVAVERALLEQARRNELRLAVTRAVVVGLVDLLDWVKYLWPGSLGGSQIPTAEVPVEFAVWFSLSVGLALLLGRGWYRPWLRFAIPAWDALALAFFSERAFSSLGEASLRPAGTVVTLALACGLYATSGGLRLSRGAGLLTTVLAVAVYVGVTRNVAAWGERVYTMAVMTGVGLIGIWMADIARGAMQNEVSRITLQRFLPGKVLEGAYGDPAAYRRSLAMIAGCRSIKPSVDLSVDQA